MRPSPARDVTMDGMIRVAAVVAAMAELDASDAPNAPALERPLNDLIAKAAQVVAGHASVIRGMRSRGLAQQGRSRESLRNAASGPDAANPRTLDFVR